MKEGAVASFLMNIKYMAVEQPKDYSDENVSNIMASISERETSKVTSADAESPNVIAIMNESWADFESFGNLELSESVMDYIQSLDAVRGSAYASVFGAGTSTSEFEFLTGNSMAFLPSGSIPYQQYILGRFRQWHPVLKMRATDVWQSIRVSGHLGREIRHIRVLVLTNLSVLKT